MDADPGGRASSWPKVAARPPPGENTPAPGGNAPAPGEKLPAMPVRSAVGFGAELDEREWVLEYADGNLIVGGLVQA